MVLCFKSSQWRRRNSAMFIPTWKCVIVFEVRNTSNLCLRLKLTLIYYSSIACFSSSSLLPPPLLLIFCFSSSSLASKKRVKVSITHGELIMLNASIISQTNFSSCCSLSYAIRRLRRIHFDEIQTVSDWAYIVYVWVCTCMFHTYIQDEKSSPISLPSLNLRTP